MRFSPASMALFLLLFAALLEGAQVASSERTTPVCEEDASEQERAALINNLVEWIKENGGIVDDRQVFKRKDRFSPQNVYATSFIPEGTLLLSVPWDLVVEPKEYSDNEPVCDMVEILSDELEANKSDDLDLSFIEYLESLTDPFVIPTAWSQGGKDLLNAILGENLLPKEEGIDRHFDEWKDFCNVKESVAKKHKKAAMLVIGYKSPIPPGEEDQDWHHMVPLYDLYSPREDDTSTVFVQDNKGQMMNVIASRDIEGGESIHTPLGFGVMSGAGRRFIHSGALERRHSFIFTDPSAPHEYQDLSVKFDLDIIEEYNERVYHVTWVDSIQPDSRAFDLMERELDRMKNITKFLSHGSLYVLHPATEYERKAIETYSSSLIDALSAVLKTRHDPRPVTPWTMRDYEVAGVNLATYNLVGVEEQKEPEAVKEPFELYRDFDISDRVIGNENWNDMIEYRRNLNRPSISFYVDKVARKRWLPTQGIPQPRQYVLKYGFELAESGNKEEEASALHELIPDDKDYAAKPSHHSEGVSVSLVSHDIENNVTSFSSAFSVLKADENAKFDKMRIAQSLSKHLHAKASDQESLALRNVKPGVVVEERFVEVDRSDRAPIEFNCFVIWGQLWIAKVMYIKGEKRLTKTWLYRDGSAIAEKEKLPAELDYVDWPRIVEIAEALGRNKDMFRVDVFVGLPASSPLIHANASREERAAAVEIAVNECEVYPTTNFKVFPQLAQDGARLWIAGYKMLNYRMVADDEIPNEFVEVGSLSEL